MSIDEYMNVLAGMDVMSRVPRPMLLDYAYGTYGRSVMLVKPSLYFSLFVRPWNFVCSPFNKLIRWIGEHMPLYDFDGKPMNDKWIHFSVMLKMAGFIPKQDYGWHIVDEQPISDISVKKFKRYFKSQCKASDNTIAFRSCSHSGLVTVNKKVHKR